MSVPCFAVQTKVATKYAITENLNELEKNKMRVFKLKFLNERLSKQAQDSFELLEGLRFKRSDLVESLKTRISSIETTAEKVQTQDKLFTLKKNKLSIFLFTPKEN